MARRFYHKKKSSGGMFKVVFGLAVVVGIGWFGYQILKEALVFNPNKLVENSVLKAEVFATPVEEITSREGIKAYYFEDHTNPIVSISFLFKNAGSAYDPQWQFGVANMTASLLTEGAGKYNSQQFKEVLEDKAISISYSVDKDDFGGSMLTLKNNLREAADLLKLTLTEPAFDRSDINRVKEQMLIAIDRQTEYPESLLGLVWAQDLYGSHPYGRNPVGKKADIKELDKEKLQKFMQDKLTRSNLVVGIAGDISRTEAEKLLDKVFGGLPEGMPLRGLVDAKVYFDGHEKNVRGELPQAVAIFTAQGVARNDVDFYPLYIANQIFGGSGLNSRVSKAAREDKGLTYGVGSYLVIDDKAKLIRGGFSATPDNYKQVQEIVKAEWLKMGQGVTKDEFEQARNYMTASYNLRFASLPDIAATLVAMQKENLGRDFLQKRNDYVNAVTLDDVNAAAAKYFGRDSLVWVSVGTKNEMEEQ